MGTGPNPVNEMQAEVFKALGHPIRLMIVRYLAGGEHAVSEIVQAAGAEQSNVSRHLSLLRQAGVLSSRKDGLKVYYQLSSSDLAGAISRLLTCVQDMVRARLRASESMLARAAEADFRPSAEAGRMFRSFKSSVWAWPKLRNPRLKNNCG